MDRSFSLGMIISNLMTHVAQEFKKNQNFFKNTDLSKDFAIPIIQDNRDYFIGFCSHKDTKINEKSSIVSTPKYGMLFRPKTNGHDSLYIGPCNNKGEPHTDASLSLEGIYYSDLDFCGDPKSSDGLDDSTAANVIHKQKSYYRGGFVNGLFEGTGEIKVLNKEDFIIDMPLILNDTMQFKNYT